MLRSPLSRVQSSIHTRDETRASKTLQQHTAASLVSTTSAQAYPIDVYPTFKSLDDKSPCCATRSALRRPGSNIVWVNDICRVVRVRVGLLHHHVH